MRKFAFEEEEEYKPEPIKDVEVRTIISGDLFKQKVQYGVIVEMWDKRKFGRIGKAFKDAFNEQERAKLTRWYANLYRWYLVTGTPLRVAIQLNTLHLLQRAANFFGTI